MYLLACCQEEGAKGDLSLVMRVYRIVSRQACLLYLIAQLVGEEDEETM